MHVALIAKPGAGVTGTSRYTENLYQGLKTAGIDASLAFPEPVLFWPPVQNGLKRLGVDVKAFFASYPLKVRPGQADIYHLTIQTLASLLMVQRFEAPVIVTVLDIIPCLVRRNPELNTFRHARDFVFYRFSMAGLKRASALVAISEYTKRTLVGTLGLPADRIHVIYPNIDLAVFHPQGVPAAFLEKYGLSRNSRHILYVGTNDPRKNLPTLVQAFSLLKQSCKNIKLIKVGADPFPQERRRLAGLIAQSGLEEDVLFFDNVPDEDLAHFYNFADLFVFPSFYEGFGIPVVEAMACGTPVVCSNATSLPEVAGSAARLVDPGNIESLADVMDETLEDQGLRERMRIDGINQAARFDGEETVQYLIKIYQTLFETLRS